MHRIVRYALGLFFVVSALEYIPASVFMLGVQNPYGPSWVIPAIPLVQGLINALAGVWLMRSGRSDDVAASEAQWPTVKTILQLFGVYFAVGGVVSLARPASEVLFFNESMALGAGSSIASAVIAIVIGAYLIARPHPLSAYLEGRGAA
jgi:hypothetical protein